jgi:hypothetical protein
VRRPVAWLVAAVLLVEGFFIAAFNWFLGVVVDRQDMSLAGLDPDAMSLSSKIGGIVFGAYFVLCALVALLVAVRNRAPAGLGRILLIGAAVVHGLLGAFAVGLKGWAAFTYMIVVLALIVLLLMTYDAQQGPTVGAGESGPEDTPGGTGGAGGGTPGGDAPAPPPVTGSPAPTTP